MNYTDYIINAKYAMELPPTPYKLIKVNTVKINFITASK